MGTKTSCHIVCQMQCHLLTKYILSAKGEGDYSQEPRNNFYLGGAQVNKESEILTNFQNFT